jgi:hypothetical protein
MRGRKIKKKPFILFHWSPISRRKSILRYGLCPNKISRCGQWKPPYVCFSRSPSLAWCLSAMLSEKRSEWDLWMVWSDLLNGYETISTDGSHKPTEYRVYHRIMKKDIWYVGTRKFYSRRHD